MRGDRPKVYLVAGYIKGLKLLENELQIRALRAVDPAGDLSLCAWQAHIEPADEAGFRFDGEHAAHRAAAFDQRLELVDAGGEAREVQVQSQFEIAQLALRLHKPGCIAAETAGKRAYRLRDLA